MLNFSYNKYAESFKCWTINKNRLKRQTDDTLSTLVLKWDYNIHYGFYIFKFAIILVSITISFTENLILLMYCITNLKIVFSVSEMTTDTKMIASLKYKNQNERCENQGPNWKYDQNIEIEEFLLFK